MDQDKIQAGVKLILEGIGEDLEREGLKETPKRIARMYEEICGGIEKSPKEYLERVFTVEDNELVLEKDINFYSLCEHHLLPFFGQVHIAYIPDGKVLGLSKLARTVEVFARRLQLQERLTEEIASAFMEHLKPKGVIVMVEAEHLCMTMRGIQKPGSKTVSMVSKGACKDNTGLINSFLQMIK